MLNHSTKIDRCSSAALFVALMVLAADTSRLPRIAPAVWALMYGTAAAFYAVRVIWTSPPVWLRALSLSSLIVVSVLRAVVLWSVDGRLAPAGLGLTIVVLALREPPSHVLTLIARRVE